MAPLCAAHRLLATAAVEPPGSLGSCNAMPAPSASFPTAAMGGKLSAPEALAFDRWLHDRLGRLYDKVLREPLPESLRTLLEQPPK